MSIIFNADEVYEMGIEIEKNGKRFYEIAGEKTEDPDTKKLFSDLAKWEDSHVSIFEKLSSELPEKSKEETVFDPDNELHLYLKAAADSHIFLINKDTSSLVSSCKTVEEVLRLALQFEKDSVVLYTSMKNLVPERLGKETIDKLANEEIAHISFVQKQLSNLQ